MSGIRVAFIDDDSGLMTVLERRLQVLRWDRSVLAYAAVPEQLASMRLHALVVNPALTGMEYIEWTARALPGLALLAIAGPMPVADRVRGLRTGADDWITKPCHPEELVARIEAVLRRRRAGQALPDDANIEAGELSIRPDRFDVYVGDQPAALSRKEYELLRRARLGRRPGARARGHLPAGMGLHDGPRRPLRRRVRAQAAPEARASSRGWHYVHTHFGVGYRFAAVGPDGTEVRSAGPAAEAPRPAGRGPR